MRTLGPGCGVALSPPWWAHLLLGHCSSFKCMFFGHLMDQGHIGLSLWDLTLSQAAFPQSASSVMRP